MRIWGSTVLLMERHLRMREQDRNLLWWVDSSTKESNNITTSGRARLDI